MSSRQTKRRAKFVLKFASVTDASQHARKNKHPRAAKSYRGERRNCSRIATKFGGLI